MVKNQFLTGWWPILLVALMVVFTWVTGVQINLRYRFNKYNTAGGRKGFRKVRKIIMRPVFAFIAFTFHCQGRKQAVARFGFSTENLEFFAVKKAKMRCATRLQYLAAITVTFAAI